MFGLCFGPLGVRMFDSCLLRLAVRIEEIVSHVYTAAITACRI